MINLNALPSGKKKGDRDTCNTSHLNIIVNEHQFVQKPLWEISILQFEKERMFIGVANELHFFFFFFALNSSFQSIEKTYLCNRFNIKFHIEKSKWNYWGSQNFAYFSHIFLKLWEWANKQLQGKQLSTIFRLLIHIFLKIIKNNMNFILCPKSVC